MNRHAVTVTANASIDKVLYLDWLKVGEINRPRRLSVLAGGKGLNVTRALGRLGIPLCACILLGGYCGRWIEALLEEEGINFHAAWGDGESRTCTSIIDSFTGQTTSVYEQGFYVTPNTWRIFEKAVVEKMEGAQAVIISGSLPPGAPVDGYARLVHYAGQKNAPVYLDARGEALNAALLEKPEVLKINAEEASEITGYSIETLEDAAGAAQCLHEKGIGAVVITVGARGSVAVSVDGVWEALPPAVKTISAVGSGDAFLGGLVFALLKSADFSRAICLGTAAGAANAATFGAGNIDAGFVFSLAEQVQVRRISPP